MQTLMTTRSLVGLALLILAESPVYAQTSPPTDAFCKRLGQVTKLASFDSKTSFMTDAVQGGFELCHGMHIHSRSCGRVARDNSLRGDFMVGFSYVANARSVLPGMGPCGLVQAWEQVKGDNYVPPVSGLIPSAPRIAGLRNSWQPYFVYKCKMPSVALPADRWDGESSDLPLGLALPVEGRPPITTTGRVENNLDRVAEYVGNCLGSEWKRSTGPSFIRFDKDNVAVTVNKEQQLFGEPRISENDAAHLPLWLSVTHLLSPQ